MPTLEAQLTAITREFVANIVRTIRKASFAELAEFPPSGSAEESPLPIAKGAAAPRTKRAGRPGRQTAETRAELGDAVLAILKRTTGALNARAIADGLGLEARLLETPLRELREAGKITKHGDKRATTYSAR